MAVKWAVANGNWNAGATWNNGTVPAIDDIVYCNGHEITFNIDIISCSELRNDANNDYSIVAGGNLYYGPGSITKTLNANVFFVTNSLFRRQGRDRLTFYINGNVEMLNSAIVQTTASSGNLDPHDFYINGNVTTNYYLYRGAYASFIPNSITINGRLKTSSLITESGFGVLRTLYINGMLETQNITINPTKTIINGLINYTSTSNNKLGVNPITLEIQNPETFVWKDITEPRANPFIILTDAELANRQQYPAESDVRKDVEYAWGALKGQLEQVQVGCVTKEDVREGVPLIGMYEDGQQVVGTIIIPVEEDVREGVHYDNDKIGTLIVQGGGDRLRIADFGYYTNAQSDTYIVDITEADKPKFASAEERILIEMFPTLDLDNIPQMYFDDLFVKYLKYRLIVEYYRTAGVNSTFTPSEPTTEIVNYRNVTCEVWLNSANIYLNAWNKKYDLNKPPKKVRL